jgi:hypothetical protein
MLKKQIIFVDQINFSSLFLIVFLYHSKKTIFHFDPISMFFGRVLKMLQIFRILPMNVIKVKSNVGQIRNQEGSNGFADIRHSILSICDRITNEHLLPNPLIQGLKKKWELNKLLLFFKQKAEKEIHEECFRVGLIKWIVRTQHSEDLRQCAVLIKHRKWLSHVKEYADSEELFLLGYPAWAFLSYIFQKLGEDAKKILPILVRFFLNQFKRSIKKNTPPQINAEKACCGQNPKSVVAINYWGQNLSFASDERSEFLWVNGSGIPYSGILLYNYFSDTPIDDDIQKQLKTHGVQVFGQGPEIPAWRPSSLTLKIFTRYLVHIIKTSFIVFAHEKRISWYILVRLMAMTYTFSKWYEFFKVNHVRINVGTQNTSIGQSLAMDALGVVNCAYQYSASNLFYPHHLLSSGEDVFFMFSSIFEKLWRSVDSPVENFIKIGFINEVTFKKRSSDDIEKIKNNLIKQNVSFTICFFDENSVDQWNIGSHKEASDDYEFLLKWLLEDPTLGLVFKPKRYDTLFERIDCISNFIEQANETKRCFFIPDYRGNNTSPADVAQIADVCIGKLSGVTAAFEASLKGAKTLLIDTNCYYQHPFYSWATERVLFDKWDGLRSSVEQFRTDPDSIPGFGDWKPEINDLDPFQDGKASLRMGSYLCDVYNALERGATKQIAIEQGNRKFQDRWPSQ